MIYTKPLLLRNEDMAEGVYAASGNPVSQLYSYALHLEGGWEGNKNYTISFTNNSSEKVDSITVTLKLIGNVTGIDGNVTAVINGNTATVSFDNFTNGIEANSTTTPTYMHVTGTGDFSVE